MFKQLERVYFGFKQDCFTETIGCTICIYIYVYTVYIYIYKYINVSTCLHTHK